MLKKKTVVVILIAVLSLTIFMTGCGKSATDEALELSKQQVAKISPFADEYDKAIESIKQEDNSTASEKDISYEAFVGTDGHLIVIFKNISTHIIPDFEADVIFYDKDGKIQSSEQDGHDAVLPGAQVVSGFDLPTEADLKTAVAFDKYEINIKAENDNDYECYANDIKIDANKGPKGVVVAFENQSKKNLDEVELTVVYYKNSKPVSISNAKDFYDIQAGGKDSYEFSTYGIEFDNFKVFINQAHVFPQ